MSGGGLQELIFALSEQKKEIHSPKGQPFVLDAFCMRLSGVVAFYVEVLGRGLLGGSRC
jgi:hypothetical protein